MKRRTSILLVRAVTAAMSARARWQLSRAKRELFDLRRRIFSQGQSERTYYLEIRLAGRYANSPAKWITICSIEAFNADDADLAARTHLSSWAKCAEDYRLVPASPVNTEARS